MFPKYREKQEPLLAELSRRGGKARPSDRDANGRTVYQALADHFNLSSADLAELIFERNGAARSKWENMVRWARNDLRKRNLLDGTRWGIWALSAVGDAFLQERQAERAGRGVLPAGIAISPERLRELQQRAQEIGGLGEAIVLEHERLSLERLGRPDLAAKISHVAKVNAAAGFDILSYTEDGAEKFIEVKTTTTDSETFEITSNEWTVARQRGQQYWVYHVRNAHEPIPSIAKLHDPSALVDLGKLLLRPTSFQVVPTESSET